MKHPTAKRPKSGLRYFTPALYLRFNSADDAIADDADEAWEQAIRNYHSHLDRIRADLPPRVREFAESICLHDAELVSMHEDVRERELQIPYPVSVPVAVISLKQPTSFITLTYLMWGELRQLRAGKQWPFSKGHVHWLYDEFDTDDRHPGLFWHRILWSDGRVTEIPLVDVVVHSFSVNGPERTEC
jgi:hypothetical protein